MTLAFRQTVFELVFSASFDDRMILLGDVVIYFARANFTINVEKT